MQKQGEKENFVQNDCCYLHSIQFITSTSLRHDISEMFFEKCAKFVCSKDLKLVENNNFVEHKLRSCHC